MGRPTSFRPPLKPQRSGAQIVILALLGAVLASAALAGPLETIVGVRARIPPDAATAEVLGTEREGSGVVIGEDGLVLTIGYVILEAESVEIVLPDSRRLPASVVAYDYDTGFGLLRPVLETALEPVSLGESAELLVNNQVLIVGFDGGAAAHKAYVISRREFAGYWEYLLPDAIFTAPPISNFAGAALFGPDGALLGIGSLIVSEAAAGRSVPGNMFVPIDALKPILPELLKHGRSSGPVRPWLGVYAGDHRGHIFIDRVAPGGPAAKAGLSENDIILAVGGTPVKDLADFYHKLWALGEAGIEVPLTVLKGGGVVEVDVTSADRYDYLKLDPGL